MCQQTGLPYIRATQGPPVRDPLSRDVPKLAKSNEAYHGTLKTPIRREYAPSRDKRRCLASEAQLSAHA